MNRRSSRLTEKARQETLDAVAAETRALEWFVEDARGDDLLVRPCGFTLFDVFDSATLPLPLPDLEVIEDFNIPVEWTKETPSLNYR